MESKRSLSNSAVPAVSIIEDRKAKKLKGLKISKQNSDELVVKDNGVENCTIETLSCKDDTGLIEAMTVQELRTKLRSVGVPAKGRKHDLVSAFKCFLENRMNGESTEVLEMQESSISVGNLSVSQKAKNSSKKAGVHDFNAASGDPEPQQTKRRSKQSQANDKTIRVNNTNMTTKKKVSIESNEVSGLELTTTKRKAFTEFDSSSIKYEEEVHASQDEPWTVLAHKKPQNDWIPYNPRTMRPPPLNRDTKNLKILSWNVNGLRALLKLEGFSALQLAEREDFDVLCLQETKLQEKDVEDIRQCLIDGYKDSFWTCSVSKLGYSGTAIISRVKPLSVRYGLGISDHDSEGRLVTAEFDSFYLLSSYVPNSGDGLKRLSYRVTEWDRSLSNYMKELEKSKPVVLTGDLNCAHEEIDIYNPAGNKRSAGFTNEERQSFETNYLSRGFIDTFRNQHPGVVGYTYWGYRHGGRKTNRGWRLDYFLVSESIAENVHDSYILPDVLGSDHCPIGLILKL